MPRHTSPTLMLTPASRALHTPVEASERAQWTAARRRAWDRRHTSPETYFYDYTHPMYRATCKRFTPREHAHFLAALRLCAQAPHAWGAVALLLPGRDGAQCRRYFHRIGRAGFITYAGAIRRRLVSRAVVTNDHAPATRKRGRRSVADSDKLRSSTPVFLRRNLRKFVPNKLPKLDDKLLRSVDTSFLRFSKRRKSPVQGEGADDEFELEEKEYECIQKHMQQLSFMPAEPAAADGTHSLMGSLEKPSTPTQCTEHSDESASLDEESERTTRHITDSSRNVNGSSTSFKNKADRSARNRRSPKRRESGKKSGTSRAIVRSAELSRSSPTPSKYPGQLAGSGNLGTRDDVSSDVPSMNTQSSREELNEKRKYQKEGRHYRREDPNGSNKRIVSSLKRSLDQSYRVSRKCSEKKIAQRNRISRGICATQDLREKVQGGQKPCPTVAALHSSRREATRWAQRGCTEPEADSVPNRTPTNIDLTPRRGDEQEHKSCVGDVRVGEKRGDPHKPHTVVQLELLCGKPRVKRVRAATDVPADGATTGRAATVASEIDSAARTQALNCSADAMERMQCRDCTPAVQTAVECDEVIRARGSNVLQFEQCQRLVGQNTRLADCHGRFDVGDIIVDATDGDNVGIGYNDQDEDEDEDEDEDAGILLDMARSDDETEGQEITSAVAQDEEMDDVTAPASAHRRIGAPSRAERASLSFLLCSDEDEGSDKCVRQQRAGVRKDAGTGQVQERDDMKTRERRVGKREEMVRTTARLFAQDVCAHGAALGHAAERRAVQVEAGRRCDAVAQRVRTGRGEGAEEEAGVWDEGVWDEGVWDEGLWDEVGAWLAARMDEMERRQMMGVEARARLAAVMRL